MIESQTVVLTLNFSSGQYSGPRINN